MNKIYEIFKLSRPKQWLKNILIFAGLIFSKKFFEMDQVISCILGFIGFSLISSSLYSLNDILDYKKDQLHPIKKNRPIASGKVTVAQGFWFSIILLIISLIISWKIDIKFFFCVVTYYILTFLYSIKLKHVVILDVIIISIGFVLRAISGTFIVNVTISPWLLICTFLLALLIAFGKRRNELKVLGENAQTHRKNLKEYNIQILDYFILIISSTTIMAYSLYTISSRTKNIIHTDDLKYTIPFVVYGILRYVYITFTSDISGEPESLLYKDKNLLMDVLLWAVTVIFILIYS